MKKRLVIVLAAVLTALSFGGLGSVYAGSSRNEAAHFDTSTAVDTGRWANPSGSVGVSGNALSFTETTSDNALVINRGYADDIHEYYPEREEIPILEADFTISAESVSGQFGFLYGMRSTTSSESFGRAGQSAVLISENGGKLSVSAVYFETRNEPTEIAPAVEIGDASAQLGVRVRLSRIYSGEEFSESLTVQASSGGGEWVTVADGAEGGPSVGYFGFGQNGQNLVQVTACTAYVYEYVTAANTSDADTACTADFDSGTYNLNEWYVEGNYGYFSPSFLGVRDGKLVFQNMANASISTVYRYSNLELSFTLSDLVKTAAKDGEPVAEFDPAKSVLDQYDHLVSSGLYIVLGCEEYEGQALDSVYFYIEPYYGTEENINATVNGSFTEAPGCTRLTYFDGQERICRLLPDNLWSEEVGDVSFRISMVDGAITFEYSIAEDVCTEIDLPDAQVMPYGHVKLVSKGFGRSVCSDLELAEMGDKIRQANFSLDNISLRNLDTDADKVLVTVPFEGIEYEKTDYEYTDTWSDEDLIWNRLGGAA